eukprot:IDg21402t1
MAPQITI